MIMVVARVGMLRKMLLLSIPVQMKRLLLTAECSATKDNTTVIATSWDENHIRILISSVHRELLEL